MQAYLDNSATTPLCDEAKARMRRAMDVSWGNPSSLHAIGLDALLLLEESRADVAKALHCSKEELLFCSGGTEANNLALFGAAKAKAREGRRIVISAVEHPSVMKAAQQLASEGFDLQLLPVDRFGVVKDGALEDAINGDTILVSLMAVNNELGAVEPIERVASVIKQKKAPALFHVDAVQAFGKTDLNPRRIGCDLMTVSAHKIHGPKGVGALYVRQGVRLRPRTFGGEQENTLRPGTEPTVAIAGFGGAASVLQPNKHYAHVKALRDAFVKEAETIPGLVRNSGDDAIPYIIHFSLPGYPAETLLNFLSERGVFVSSGSACAKGHRSPVLTAAGLSTERIESALRVSLSGKTTKEELDKCLSGLRDAVSTLRRKG